MQGPEELQQKKMQSQKKLKLPVGRNISNDDDDGLDWTGEEWSMGAWCASYQISVTCTYHLGGGRFCFDGGGFFAVRRGGGGGFFAVRRGGVDDFFAIRRGGGGGGGLLPCVAGLGGFGGDGDGGMGELSGEGLGNGVGVVVVGGGGAPPGEACWPAPLME
jgi:hypothetical protein